MSYNVPKVKKCRKELLEEIEMLKHSITKCNVIRKLIY
jgi:hypothetical protein